MEQKAVDMAMQKLREDPDFKKALEKYEEAEKLSQEYSAQLAKQLIDILHLDNKQQTIEEARYNLVVAKMSAAKLLATISSFSYIEKDFMDSLIRARQCVQDELIPMLIQQEPCGECESCKNGHPEQCIRPHVRDEYCESRFLPLLSDALIEYDAWSEILYNNIPADKKDSDVLQDLTDDFNNEINQLKIKKGNPPKEDTVS